MTGATKPDRSRRHGRDRSLGSATARPMATSSPSTARPSRSAQAAAPASTAVASGSGVSRQHRHRRGRQLDRLSRHHRHSDGDGRRLAHRASTSPAASRLRLITTGVCGDRGSAEPDQPRDRRRCRSRCTSSTGADSRSPARPTSQGARPDATAIGGGNTSIAVARTTSCRHARLPDPGRLDPERRWPRHHLQERTGPGSPTLRRSPTGSGVNTATSSPTASATRRSICRPERSPTC